MTGSFFSAQRCHTKLGSVARRQETGAHATRRKALDLASNAKHQGLGGKPLGYQTLAVRILAAIHITRCYYRGILQAVDAIEVVDD